MIFSGVDVESEMFGNFGSRWREAVCVHVLPDHLEYLRLSFREHKKTRSRRVSDFEDKATPKGRRHTLSSGSQIVRSIYHV